MTNDWLKTSKTKEDKGLEELEDYLESKRLPEGVPAWVSLTDRDIMRGEADWPGDDVAKQIAELYLTTLGCSHHSRAVKRYYEQAEKLVAEARARRKRRK